MLFSVDQYIGFTSVRGLRHHQLKGFLSRNAHGRLRDIQYINFHVHLMYVWLREVKGLPYSILNSASAEYVSVRNEWREQVLDFLSSKQPSFPA